jgi:hypothetical protein
VSGIQGNVDANWIAPVFRAILGDANSVPPDVTTTPHDGWLWIDGSCDNWEFELFKIDPAKNDFELVYCSPLETVSHVAARKGATLAVAAGEWDRRISKPKDYTVVDGEEIIPRDTVAARPSLFIHPVLKPIINHINVINPSYAFTGLRYLIRDGVLQPYLSGTEPQYTEGHSRTIYGVTASGELLVMCSEGAYPNQGLTLYQCALIMQQYGAVSAFDGGGGGDMTCILDGQSLLMPENPDGAERYLPAVFCVMTKKGTPMTMRYEATAKGDNTKLRPNHNTVTDFNPIQSFIAGTKFYGDVLWIADAINKDSSQYVGDKWLQTDPTHWVAIIHRGVEICTLIDHGETPPPATEKVLKAFDLHIEAEAKTAKETVLYTDGTSEVKDYKTA